MGWYQRRVHGECCGHNTAFNMNQIILVVALFGSLVLSEEVVRKPKLFFVNTSATTSTLQTASICYVSTAQPQHMPLALGEKGEPSPPLVRWKQKFSRNKTK